MAVVTVAFSELESWLQAQPANTADTPYELNITGLTADDLGDSTDTGTLGYTLKRNNTKYVDLRPTTLPLRENMDSAFFECTTLVYCPSLPQGVKDLTYCFGSCNNIKSDGFPIIPSSAERLYGTFNACYSMVTAPAIPNGVKNIQNYCSNCTSLTSIPEIPQSVENMSNAFIRCDAVTSWHQKSAKFPNLEEAYTFLPNSATFTIYSDTPYEMRSLLSTYSTSSTCSYTLYGDCAEIPFADLNNELSALDDNTASTPYKIKVTGLTANDVGNSSTSGTLGYVLKENNTKYIDLSYTTLPIKEDITNGFYECITLVKSPVIPNGIKTMNYCFKSCTSLTNASDIPSSVINMIGCFYNCTVLVTAPYIQGNVTNMQDCFRDCVSLEVVPNIPDSVTGMTYTFLGCTSLVSVPTIPNNVTSMYGTFIRCSALTNAPTLPEGVSFIRECFRSCTSLTIVPMIPDSVTDMRDCFNGCTSLEEITLFEADLESLVTNNKAYDCFSGCTSLTKIGLPSELAETDEWHCFRLKFGATTVEGKVYDKTKTAVTIQQTTVTKGTLKLPIKTDELWFPSSGYTDAEIDAIIEKVIQYRYSYFNDETVLNPASKNMVLWADDKDHFTTNIEMGGGESVPVGFIQPQYKKVNRAGWLYLDGSTFDENEYPALYLYLGTNVLPDYREFGLVGAEENTTDVYDATTNPNGTIHDHDIYTEGQAKDDQMQRITGYASNYTENNSSSGAFYYSSSSSYKRKGSSSSWSNGNFLFDSSRVTRTGYESGTLVGEDVTRGKRKAVYFYIKAIDGETIADENQFMGTVKNYLKTAESYSTEEVATGGVWIDGNGVEHTIYKKVVNIGNLPNATIKDVAHNISNFGQLVKTYGTWYDGTWYNPLPFAGTSSAGASITINVNATYVRVQTGTNRSSSTGIVTIEYTKAS